MDNSRMRPLVISPAVPQNNEGNALQYQGFLPCQNLARFPYGNGVAMGKQQPVIQNMGYGPRQTLSNMQNAYSYGIQGMQQYHQRYNEFTSVNYASAVTQKHHTVKGVQMDHLSRSTFNQYSNYTPMASNHVQAVNNVSYNYASSMSLPPTQGQCLNPQRMPITTSMPTAYGTNNNPVPAFSQVEFNNNAAKFSQDQDKTNSQSMRRVEQIARPTYEGQSHQHTLGHSHASQEQNTISVPSSSSKKIQTPIPNNAQTVNLQAIADTYNRKIESHASQEQNTISVPSSSSHKIQTPIPNNAQTVNLQAIADTYNRKIESPPVLQNTNRKIESPPVLQNSKGKFNWIVIEGIKVPSVLYDNSNYLVVRLVEDKILAYFPSEMPEEVQSLPPLNSIPLQPEHIELFNAINDHYNLDFKVYSTDLLVKCGDFIKFYNVIKKTFPECVARLKQVKNEFNGISEKSNITSKNNLATSTNEVKKDLPHKTLSATHSKEKPTEKRNTATPVTDAMTKDLSHKQVSTISEKIIEQNTPTSENDAVRNCLLQKNGGKQVIAQNTRIPMDEKGWVQLNNTIMPFLYVKDVPYIPLPIIQSAAQLAISEDLSILLEEAECKILNEMVSVINDRVKFKSESTRFISLGNVLDEHKDKVKFVKYLPGREPKKEAVFVHNTRTDSSTSRVCGNTQVNTNEKSSSSLSSPTSLPVISDVRSVRTGKQNENTKEATINSDVARQDENRNSLSKDPDVPKKSLESTSNICESQQQNKDSTKCRNNNDTESLVTDVSVLETVHLKEASKDPGHSMYSRTPPSIDSTKCINNNLPETGQKQTKEICEHSSHNVMGEGNKTTPTESTGITFPTENPNSNKESTAVKTSLQKIKRLNFNGKTLLSVIRDGKLYILLEAISRVFFPCLPLQNFLDGVHVICGTEPVVECTEIEENSFKAMYCISGKLICNKLIEASIIEPNMTLLEEMFQVIEDGSLENNNQNILKRKLDPSTHNTQKRNCVNEIICL